MALLATCWFIIEYVLIPDGFRKWYCLRFFIHPSLLIFCQIFLWIKLLISWIVSHIFHPLRIILFASLRVFKFFKNYLIHLFPSERSNNCEVLQEVTNCEVDEICNLAICNPIQSIPLYYCYSVPQILDKPKSIVENQRRNGFDEEQDNKEELVLHITEVMDMDVDTDMDESPSLSWNFEAPFVEREVQHDIEEEETDPFYKKYIERMRWFDLLNYERSCGISAILNKQLGTPTSMESVEPRDFSLPFFTWSKVSRGKLLKSLESDFERVYVGQTCLCWEALHHQYRKVEALVCSSSQEGLFYDNEAGNFQKFQVLLERFMENEWAEGKRLWNYVQGRFSLKSLLQVPKVSDYLEEEKEGMRGEGMRAREVLKAIEKSIWAFWVFIQTDNKKSRWKFGGLIWNNPPVEDPKDLGLLADLTKGLQKKELMLKDLQRKKRCCLKKANQIEESQRSEILYSMIDMKLVSRVLKMSMISTQQLKWCQDKLNNIEFKEGKVIRPFTSCLFPP